MNIVPIILFILFLIFIRKLEKNYKNIKGNVGERRVNKILEGLDDSKLLKDVLLWDSLSPIRWAVQDK